MVAMAGPAKGTGIATRDAYGEVLAQLGAENPDIVVLDADLSPSTKTSVFAKKFPDRFFDVGIAEQNLIGVAAGLSFEGKIPFASSFAIFLAGRPWEQIRNMVCHSGANVKIVATHAGITVGEDGASHQMLEDIAIMRAIPRMRVIHPADGPSTQKIIRAVASDFGPVYVRLSRPKFPVIYDDSYAFRMGKGTTLREGKDCAIIAAGLEVSEALKAADSLKAEGIDAAVIDMACIKPLDEALVESYARKCGAIVTAEEHNILGGLGGAVCECVASRYPVPVVRVGTKDTFGESGDVPSLMEKYGLTSRHIADAARAAVRMKR
jgi:transketolase